MEAVLLLAIFLFLGPLVVSIVVAVRLNQLKSSVDELRRRVIQLETQRADRAGQPTPAKSAVPPPLPPFFKPPPVAAPAREQRAAVPEQSVPSINWESILGVKLFAWVGGLALFLGVVFFVKYAFENNLITPSMRVVAGAIIGIGLIVVGVIPAVRRYRVPAESLCATGVLILYADTFAAHAFYGLIPLSVATTLMWIVTGVALVLAAGANAQSVAVLGVLGGFLTPALLWNNPDWVSLFGYIAVLNFAVAAIATLKHWDYLILLASLGSVIAEFGWMPYHAETARNVYLGFEAQFLAVYIALRNLRRNENWSLAATAITAFAALAFCVLVEDFGKAHRWDLFFPMLLLADGGLIALAVASRSFPEKAKALAAIIGAALVSTWVGEWSWHEHVFVRGEPLVAVVWYFALFLLFAATPYFCGVNRFWPWMISAAAGPVQFWFVYQLVMFRFPGIPYWPLPVAFALPAGVGIGYLVKKQGVDVASGDSRLATQGAAVLTFVSLIFPVQFEREWITLGWALEGVALILLFRWIPNRRLRAVALIVLCAAFVRLTLNPAVFEYHPRSRTPIFNWYLCVYGVAALCFFLGARWFGQPREMQYERHASPFLYSLGGIVLFLLLNIEIADYFSIGPTLTFSFVGNFARDMTYSIAWAVFALGLLVIGIATKARGARFAAIALLCLTLAKLFLHDLDSLGQLYRIAAFITVAIIAIAASFVYQRFLSPAAK